MENLQLRKLQFMLLKSVLTFLVFISLNTYAFKLTPIVNTFDFQGRGATKTFRVTNSSKENIRLEAETFTRSIDIKNKETRVSTENFIIYPPQLELKAGQSRALRVTYVGKPVKTEVAYRLIVRQIPNKLVKKKKGANQISFLLEYIASLYVSPKNTKENLVISAGKKMGKFISFVVENKGTKHVLLRKYKLSISQGKTKSNIEFDSKTYKKFGSYNLLAGSKREVKIPYNKFSSGKVKIKLSKD